MCGNMKQKIAQRVSWPGIPAGGFTLIEVIMVVIIIGIAAAVVVPMMSSAGSMQIRAAVNLVAADLEYAKSMAISRGQFYSVVFNKTTETYQVVDKDNNVIQHPVKKGFPYVMDFRKDARIDRVEILDANFDGTPKVTFDYLGSPWNGASPTPTQLNSGVVTLRSGTITRTVRVEPVTGFITVSN